MLKFVRRLNTVPPPRDSWSGWLREEASNAAEIAIAWGRTAAAVVQLGCTIYVARLYVVDATLCVGPSMDPTCEPYVNALLPARSPLPSLSLTHALLSLSLSYCSRSRGHVFITDHFTKLWRRARPGEVVICRSPTDPAKTVCKRVIAVGPDCIEARDKWGGRKTYNVPEGHVWLEGDNPLNSTDSRTYGAVPEALIISRAVLTAWPPDRWGGVPPRPAGTRPE